jgi:hypothetical protein
MIDVREEKDFRPVYPHCDGELKETVAVRHGTLRLHYVYCCPHCRKVLGMSQGGR